MDDQIHNSRVSKLNEQSVKDIRRNAKLSNLEPMAQKYNVDKQTIRDVLNFRTWKNVK